MAAAGARWDEARVLAPAEEYGSESWLSHFDEHPDVLMQVLGDAYRIYKSEEQKRNGTANPAGGRRKSSIDGNLDELWKILSPEFSMQPFPVAFKAKLGKRSLRALAMKAGLDHRDISRKLRGGTPCHRCDYEAIARGLDVHPAYFLEWRVCVVTELLTHVLTRSPHLSVTALKALTR